MAKKTQERQGRFWYGTTVHRARHRSRQANGGTSLRVEPLESRQLLDAGMVGGLAEATTVPHLEWLTYVGGVDRDEIEDVAIAANGDVLICGYDDSNSEQPAYIAKLTSDGESVWTTHFGDTGVAWCSLAVDEDGNVVATGLSTGPDSWVSGGYVTTRPKSKGGTLWDAFVIKLDASGEHQWSTFTHDLTPLVRLGNDIAVDSAGDIYVVGSDQYQPHRHQVLNDDGFVLKISADGQGPVWSKSIGGGAWDEIWGIALDASDNVILAGSTDSDNSSGWISGSVDNQYGGAGDAFVMKLNNDGDHQWSSYLGGESDDGHWSRNGSVAVDARDNSILVTSETRSAGWVDGTAVGSPAWEKNGYDVTFNGVDDAFVAKFSPTGEGQWATYIGGNQREINHGLVVDAEGNVLVTGHTDSEGWVSGGFDSDLNDGNSDAIDAFAVMVSPEGDHVWSSYLGGANGDHAQGVAYDPAGYAVVVGGTKSPGLSTDSSTLNGTSDGFVAKIRLGPPAAPSFSINDVEVIEGDNSETATATFTVLRSGDLSGTDTVEFATEDDTGTTAATAGDDYVPDAGILTFDPDEATQQVSVTILGDTDDEGDETFLVNLSNPSTGATIADGSGVATILNDDAPLTSLYIADIAFESRRGGNDWRVLVEVRSEANNSSVEGVTLQVDFAGETYTVMTDSDGVARTSWVRKLPSGDYYANAHDLALEGYEWDPFDPLNVDDSEGDDDSWPDALLRI